MAISLPAVGFQPSYPLLVESVSVSRAGNRVVAMVDYADPQRQVAMRTVPLKASDRLLVEAFRGACRGGLVTVHYVPPHQCLPKALWGSPVSPLLANGLLAAAAGYSATISATDGLTLSPGDMISMTTGAYNWMAGIVTGGTVAAGEVAVTLDAPVPSYITVGAAVRFKDPIMNTRMLPGSFNLADEFLPVASFTLVEVPQ